MNYTCTLTEWGAAVSIALIQKRLKQKDLLLELQSRGYDIDKGTLSSLLRGRGATTKTSIIDEINKILEISVN